MSLTADARTADAGTHGWSASGPRDLKRLLKRARRHSTSVRLMRFAIPVGAVATVGGFVLLSYLAPRVAAAPPQGERMGAPGTKAPRGVPAPPRPPAEKPPPPGPRRCGRPGFHQPGRARTDHHPRQHGDAKQRDRQHYRRCRRL